MKITKKIVIPKPPAPSSPMVTAYMKGNKGKNTKPELQLRRLVSRMGYRYRLHASDLPGKPDLIFRGRKKVIFMHGCFWHQHPSKRCPSNKSPKANSHYWSAKLGRNVQRDKQTMKSLRAADWKVMVVWECELKDRELVKRLQKFLNN